MVPEFLNTVYYNNSVLNWAYFFIIIIAFLLISKAIIYFSKKLSENKKEPQTLFFLILDFAEAPLAFLTFVFGLYIGYQFLVFNEIIDFYFNNIIQLLIIIGITWIIIKLIDVFLKYFINPIAGKTKNKFDDQIIQVLSKAIKVVAIIFAILISLDNFGFDIITIVAGLGIGGLAIAFAAQKTIADVFGGLNILISRPFILGDTVEISGIIGTVEEISIRHTRIRNLDKRLVIFPNSTISENVMTNITCAPQRKTVWKIGVTYDTPIKKIEKAKKIIFDAINDCEFCQEKPVVAFDEFSSSSLDILVVFFTKSGSWIDMVKAKDEVGLKIKKEFEKNNIEFAFPTQTIHLESDNMPKKKKK